MKDFGRFKMDIKQTAKQFRVLEKIFYWIPQAPDSYLIDIIHAASDEMVKRIKIREIEERKKNEIKPSKK